MNAWHISESGLLQFSPLTDQGIIHAATADVQKWGSMRYSHALVNRTYEKLFDTLNIPYQPVAFMHVQHMDALYEVTLKNMQVYDQSGSLDGGSLPFVSLPYDALVTKASIPIVVTPADCVIIAFTGIDVNDNKRFLAVVHAGGQGTVLHIHTKVLEYLVKQFNATVETMTCALYPGVGSKFYHKKYSDFEHQEILTDKAWGKYILPIGSLQFGFDFQQKIYDDLLSHGMKNIIRTDLETWTAHEQGVLFSHAYQKHGENLGNRFAVVHYLQHS